MEYTDLDLNKMTEEQRKILEVIKLKHNDMSHFLYLICETPELRSLTVFSLVAWLVEG